MIRASIILALAWCTSRILKNRPAAERHLLWVFALGSAALLPLLALVVPAWQPEVAARFAAALPKVSAARAVQQAQQAGSAIVHAVGIEPAGGVEFVLFALWLVGAFVTLCRLLPGAVVIRRLASSSEPVPAPGWIQAGLRRKVRLLLCADNSLPLTWGFFRPRILLPADATCWSHDRWIAVLAHEAAHIRRCDWLYQMLAEATCALYWFHPLFWVARNQLHLESERACDDAVLGSGVESKEYAQHLLDIARALKRRQPRWSLAMAGQIHLEKRLIAILEPAANRRAMTWKMAVVILLPILCIVTPIVALRPALADDGMRQVLQYTLPPLYSDEGLEKQIEGVVKIEARIDRSGRPYDLRVIRGLGFGLDENAMLAVRSWKFTPGQTDTVTSVDVEFNLKNAELNELIANDMVTSVGPDVVPPRIAHRIDPRYPSTVPAAERARAVVLDAVIQDNGIPTVLRVVRSLSWAADEAAISALEQWRFSPAQKDGIPVKVRMTFEMGFAPASN